MSRAGLVSAVIVFRAPDVRRTVGLEDIDGRRVGIGRIKDNEAFYGEMSNLKSQS